jgi:hypothetical protein
MCFQAVWKIVSNIKTVIYKHSVLAEYTERIEVKDIYASAVN